MTRPDAGCGGAAGELAHRQPCAAVALMCLGCVAWDYGEAKRCEIRTCPLWALNRRIFARRQGADG